MIEAKRILRDYENTGYDYTQVDRLEESYKDSETGEVGFRVIITIVMQKIVKEGDSL